MKISILCLLIIISNVVLADTHFGDKVKVSSSVAIESIISKSSEFKGKEIIVSGVVEKLCVKKGCWLNLKAGDQSVRVTFKDYGIFVPSNFLSKKVAMKGIFDLKIESVERRKHLLEDEGAPRSEIDKINEDKKIYSIVASGIQLI